MSPAHSGRESKESAQVELQQGKIGFFPINRLALTALHHGQADCLIAEKEAPLSERLKSQATMKVGASTIDLKDRVYLGLSDAFYRGQLPELLVVTTDMTELPAFVLEFMLFIEKLCALGYTSSKYGEPDTVLDAFVPNILVCSHGIVYDAVVQKFIQSLQRLGTISERQKERLIQKIARGTFSSPSYGYELHLDAKALYDAPLALNIAGQKSLYMVAMLQTLESHQFDVSLNTNGPQGVVELELTLGYAYLYHRLLPMMEAKGITSKVTLKKISTVMKKLADGLGLTQETISSVTKQSVKPLKTDWETVEFSASDLAMLYQLTVFAKQANVEEHASVLDTLITHVETALTKEPSVIPTS